MSARHFFAPLFAVSLLVGCAAQSTPEGEDDTSTLHAEDALSATGKLLVGDYKSDAWYPRFSLAKDGTYVWDSGIRCVKAPCPSGDSGRFKIWVGAYTGTRYVNMVSSDGKVEHWLRVASLSPTKLVGVFGTTGTFTRVSAEKPVGGCTATSECGNGEQCIAGACTARPLCVQIPVASDRYQAKNFAAGQWSEASAWAETTAAGAGYSISLATCTEVAAGLACTEEYAPLCAFVSGAEGARTVSNACELRRTVIAAAGEYGEATGLSTKGECTKGEPRCSTYWLKSDPASVAGAYYVQTFRSDFEAKAWIALQPSAVDGAVLDGICSDLTICTKEYNPVCGGVRSDDPSTFGNLCMFQAAVRASSATDGWSKGYVNASGECSK